MEPECRRVTRVILPAIRASVAEVMSRRYNYNQEEIARKLDIVQVAVSKYLNRRYSSAVHKMKMYIIKNNLNRGIIEDILNGRGVKEIEKDIDSLCAHIANI